MRQTLTDLARSPRFRIWIVSGRRRADVRAKIGIRGIRYLGLHGWEGRGGALSSETRRCLQMLAARLDGCLADIPGLWIEDKEDAFAIHYRDAALPDRLHARSILGRIAGPYSNRFRIGDGKSVWEVLPRELKDKGDAVKRQLARVGGRPLAVYLGDDQTDEPAFAALRGGITVRVGIPGRSSAIYRLGGVGEVRMFLHKLRTEFA